MSWSFKTRSAPFNLAMLPHEPPHELVPHVRGAYQTGCTTRSKEILLQVGIICGVPPDRQLSRAPHRAGRVRAGQIESKSQIECTQHSPGIGFGHLPRIRPATLNGSGGTRLHFMLRRPIAGSPMHKAVGGYNESGGTE